MNDRLKNIPYLGNGIGFRPELSAFIFLNRDKIDFVEVIAEHYMDVPAWKTEELKILMDHFTVIPHAIGLSLGSVGGLDITYLKKLSGLINFINPPYWSEHISYTQAHGLDAGHLLPIVYNQAFLNTMCNNIDVVKQYISHPLILENITYHVNFPNKELSDAEFLNTLCSRSGCGLLLDVTNLYINSVNFGFNPKEVIKQIELDNIIQLHYVGFEQTSGQLIDTHVPKSQPEIIALIDYVLAQSNPRGVLLERDGNYEAQHEILEDLITVSVLLKKTRNAY